MSLFKKIGELFKAPPPRDAHGDWFYHTKVFSKKILLLYKLAINADKDNNILRTAEDIVPPELLFNSTTTEVIGKWGKPRCTFNNDKINHNIQVFFYRRNFIYESTLFQLQFYNDKLFFVCVEVGKSMMVEENKITMLTNMLPSFVTSNFKDVSSIPTIKDTHHNFLLIQDDVLLNICYLNGEFAGEKLSLLEEGKKYVANKRNEED